MRNIKIKINVSFNETDEDITPENVVDKIDDGSFRVIIDNKDEFNIDRLERALLTTTYPALRNALSEHLAQASKKKHCSSLH